MGISHHGTMPGMGRMVMLSEAAELAGVARQTLSRWVKSDPPRLKRVEQRPVGRLLATYVDLDEVRREVGKITAKQPRQDGKKR